ncbi:MAG: hypothetical protein PHU25_14875 [Deltaproteobacteria bacterium]|nr:hypothetical protein [Deltaproteobacteria bacterium]
MRITFVFMALAVGCGGTMGKAPSTEAEPAMTAEDLKPRAVLSRAELTTAADEQRMRASAPATTSFADRVGAIFLVATLKRLPTDADIDVRWFKDSDPEPWHSSHANASDRFEFVSSFRPRGSVFDPGTYTVRVCVDGEEVGAVGFRVGSADRPPTEIRELALSHSVDDETMKPRSPATSFRSGTKRIAVDRAGLGLKLDKDNAPEPEMTSFRRDTPVIECGLRFVDLPRDSKVDVQWFSVEADGDMLLHTTRTGIASGGTGTLGAAWEPGHALSPGAYKAVVLVNGEAMAELPFEIR